ncbi:MAG: TerB family tellurite resistance protein [Planctomycetes bacterium]|nr:TerB family tellurite resistance protein [Planctomycetota bacterium]
MAESDSVAFAPDQIDVFARGLYWLAGVDGIDDSEVDVIGEFLAETGSEWTIERIQASDFDPRELPAFLDTSFLRRLFLKAAVALIAADGKITERESAALHRVARLLGLSDLSYRGLEEEARKLSVVKAGADDEKKKPAGKKAGGR